MRPKPAFACISLAVLAARLCHLRVVWVEEGYPLAAAAEMLRGKDLYRDIWFDKPPLFPAFYMLFGAETGWPLRLAGAAFVVLCCWCAFVLARHWWSEREGVWAAALLAFFLSFDFAPAVMALAPDLLMVAPHLAAVWLAARGRPLASGAMCGVAMLVNPKAPFVCAACLLWQWRAAHWFVLGLGAAAAPVGLWYGTDYWQQVWEWGFVYSGHPLGSFRDGVLRTVGWVGFHAALVAGAAWAWRKERDWRLAGWALLSLAAVFTGMRFFPRYYFQLLPVMAVWGARGLALMPARWRVAALLTLLLPLGRFGPRYPMMAMGTPWADLALHDDAKEAAEILRREGARSVLVWGYRPEVYAWSRVPAGTRFLDSQPLTSVIADRHLVSSESAAPELAARNRRELVGTQPEFIVDGLGPLNPALAIGRYADLAEWLSQYREAARTKHTVIYRRR